MFAHSIKNPEIIHYFIYGSERCYGKHMHLYDDTYFPEGHSHRRFKYLCMQASATTPSKRTRNVEDVTCFNCQRELGKMAGFWDTKTIQSGKVTFWNRAKPKGTK